MKFYSNSGLYGLIKLNDEVKDHNKKVWLYGLIKLNGKVSQHICIKPKVENEPQVERSL